MNLQNKCSYRTVAFAGLLTVFSTICGANTETPTFEVFEGVSACHDLGLNSKSAAEFRYLGVSLTMSSCFAAAVSWRFESEPEGRCMSACWSKHAACMRSQRVRATVSSHDCYCRVTPTWMALPNVSVDSAVINWPCSGPGDCSYNGVCDPLSLTKCKCDPAWGGVRCGELQLLPVDRAKLGFREVNQSTGANVSTWGAPVLWDEVSQQWHGWAAEMVNDCGINPREANSQIVHIMGDQPTVPF